MGFLGIGGKRKPAWQDYLDNERGERQMMRDSYEKQLGEMRAPEMSPLYSARIKALEERSKPTSLVEDPYFQADRATLVQGGQKALSGVQNQQRALGVSGGFSNVGSQQDVLDRLSANLAQLGQQSRISKDQAAQEAAGMEQQFTDRMVEYRNLINQARLDMIAGNYDAANRGLAAAAQFRASDDQSKRQLAGGIIGGVAQGAGYAIGKTGKT